MISSEEVGGEWRAQLESLTPIPIGQGFLIVGEEAEPPDTDRVPIRLRHGLGFGTGIHHTTRACVQAIESLLTRVGQIETAADIGSGTGILSLVAAHFGAQVWATDIEDVAIAATRTNSALNGLSQRVTVTQELSDDQVFDLVVANLYSSALLAMADRLYGWTRTGGWCIISGITEAMVDDTLALFTGLGFDPMDVTVEGDCAAITLQRLEQ